MRSPSAPAGAITPTEPPYTAPLRPSDSDAYSPGSLPGNVATTQQTANYLASAGGAANPHALYVINTGNNDLIFVQNQGAAWITANPDFLSGVASQLADSVAVLQAA